MVLFGNKKKKTILKCCSSSLFSAAKDTDNNEQVAIKKVCRIFEKTILAKRALREVKLLKHFNGHENVSFYR